MRKNIGSQTVSFQMIAIADGSDVTTGTPAVYYTIDGLTQGTGGGTAASEGNGQWSYTPLQAETNGNHVAFTMVLTGAVSQTVNVWPVAFDPSDTVRAGLTALPNAAADAAGGLPISDAGGLDIDAILADTNELQGDWANGGRLDLLIDSILADTGELQTDLTDGGRLDLLIDSILADTGTAGVVISATTANQIADAILNRDMSLVSDTTARSMLNALRFLRNKWSVSGTTLTVTKEDDTTSAWTATLATNAAADPITSSDPA